MTTKPCSFPIPLVVLLFVVLQPISAQPGNPFLPDTVKAVEFQSGIRHGGYRRAMDPSHVLAAGMTGKGSAVLNGLTLGGHFGYRRETRRGVFFSGVADAYNGNPFFWGDSLSGDWRDDIVQAGATLRMPRTGRHGLGLMLGYATAVGVRTSDPKPLYRLREATVAVEYRWQVSPVLELLVRPEYRNAYEENEIGYGTQNNAFVIRSRGYGSLHEGSLVTMDRRGMSGSWGGQLALQRPGSWHMAATAMSRRDRVTEGIAAPAPDGDHRITTLSLQMAYPLESLEPALYANYTQGRGASYLSGTAANGGYTYYPVQNVFQTGWHGGIDLDWNPPIFRFLTTLGGTLSIAGDRREDALSESQYAYTNIRAGIRTGFSRKAFTGGLHVAYRHQLSGTATAALPTRMTEMIFRPDYQYFTANALLYSFSGRWYYLSKHRDTVSNRFWLQLAAEGAAANSTLRMGYSLSVGIDFDDLL